MRYLDTILSNMHVLSAEQFDPKELGQIFKQADKFRKKCETVQGKRELARLHSGQQICSLFYEPSTRTRLSFEAAAFKLGMGVISTENAGEFSSAAKGETIEDTMKVLSEYGFTAIVIRSKETGAVQRGAAASSVPVINAGDGAGEHPTQAILDAYTIQRRHGRLKNLKVVMGGDLKHGRTVRSLSQILAKYPGNHISYVSMPVLQIGDDIKTILDDHGTSYTETSDMNEVLHDADVVYWTRLQKERLANPEAVPAGGFVIDMTTLEALPKAAIIMHPLPRVDEIATEVDSDPRAIYFEQAGNGLYIRMALLDRATVRAVQ